MASALKLFENDPAWVRLLVVLILCLAVLAAVAMMGPTMALAAGAGASVMSAFKRLK